MKRAKKLIALCLLLCLLPMGGLAELTLEPVMEFMTSISAVSGSDYVIATDKETGLRGLWTNEGEPVLAPQYPNMASINRYFFSVSTDKEALNAKAILTADGRLISDFAYGSFKSYDRHWVAGCVLAQADQSKYDVKISDQYYWIDRCDFFYVEDGAQSGFLAGTIGDRKFVSAVAHGDCLSVLDRDGRVTVYDKKMNALDFTAEKTSTALYGVKDYVICNNATGKDVIYGYVSAAESRTVDGLYLIGNIYHWTGRPISTVLDAAGRTLYTLDTAAIAANADYALAVDGDKKRGLYSAREEALIVPTEYDEVLTSPTTLDAYVANGYVAVRSGGLTGFVDTRTGEMTCETKYPAENQKRIGCVLFYPEAEGGFLLVAADGVETHVDVDAISCRGDGSLLVVQKGNKYGIIDWHGGEVIPCTYLRNIVITDDSAHLIRTGTGVELDRIVR